MTLEQLALYAPVILVALTGVRMLFQLSKVVNKMETIDKRMGGMEKLHTTVARLQAQFAERSKSVDRRLKVLENYEQYPDIPA